MRAAVLAPMPGSVSKSAAVAVLMLITAPLAVAEADFAVSDPFVWAAAGRASTATPNTKANASSKRVVRIIRSSFSERTLARRRWCAGRSGHAQSVLLPNQGRRALSQQLLHCARDRVGRERVRP